MPLAEHAMRVIRAGEQALLVECERQEQVFWLYDALRGRAVDVIPGDRSLMVLADEAIADDAPLANSLRELIGAATTLASTADGDCAAQAATVIPVRYDGEDLPAVAELLGMTAADVVAAHTGSSWTAHFLGFCPGFAYLKNPRAGLTVPRRDSPRATIPAGSVALAAEYSAVYPLASPGGWQLIGHTDLALWDARRSPPALLAAGALVRFESVP